MENFNSNHSYTIEELKGLMANLIMQSERDRQERIERERFRAEQEAKLAKEKAEQEAKLAKEKAEREKERAEKNAKLAQENAEKESKWEKRIEKMEKLYGGVSKSLGDDAEYYFYKAFKRSKDAFGEHFTIVRRKVISLDKGWEYDIVLVNEKSIGVIEVKHKLTKDHVKKFVRKKLPEFRVDFVQYKDYRLYAGVAAFSFEDGSQELAVENGLYVFTRENNAVHLLNESDFQPKKY